MPYLYNLTIQKATAVCHAIRGSFSHSKAQELIIARGKSLEIFKQEEKTGKLVLLESTEVFGFIQSIISFKQHGHPFDFIAVGSDSGKVTILKFDPKKLKFEKVHSECFGKAGVRRVVPGRYIAADPRGRAIMVASVEKSKFVYVLNRDAAGNLTICSPLEAHKSNQVVFALCAVDNGYENPIFASIEVNVEAASKFPQRAGKNQPEESNVEPQKGLCWWEMDLGLNHIVKKCTLPLPASAHALIPLPPTFNSVEAGISGVLVCCENFILYKKPDHPDVVCAFPRRLEMGKDKNMMIVAHTVMRLRDQIFVLVQNDYGDLFKVDVVTKDGQVSQLVTRYFDTIPIVNALTILKSGYLFCGSEFGNHFLFQFTSLTSDDAACTSDHPAGRHAIVAFKPRALVNIQIVEEIPSYAPIIDVKVMDSLSEGTPQIYALCGRGPRSKLRILQHGLSVEEMADNELPGKPRGIWTLKESIDDVFHRYLVVSFVDSTLLMAVGETVEETTSPVVDGSVSTIHICLMHDDSILQIHDFGWSRVSQTGKETWQVPPGKKIVCADSNEQQLCFVLNDGEVFFFELDEANSLVEISRKNLGQEFSCISVQPIPPNRLRGNFVAVGGLDNTVRLLSLEKDRPLRQLSIQALSGNTLPESCCIATLTGLDEGRKSTSTILNIGVENGVVSRSTMDPLTGQLSQQRGRFLGSKAVKITRVEIGPPGQRQPAFMCLCVKPWIGYTMNGQFHLSPLQYDQLDFATSFSSEACPEGFVATSGKNLRIFRCTQYGTPFSESIVPLECTPRRLTPLPPPVTEQQIMTGMVSAAVARQCMLAVIQADHNSYDSGTKQAIKQALEKIRLDEGEESNAPVADIQNGAIEATAEVSEEMIGTFKAGPGKWGSLVQIIDPQTLTTLHKVYMDIDEAAVSICVCRFVEYEFPCLVVGTVLNLTLKPRKVPLASIKVYAYDINFSLTLLHSTPVEDAPMCLTTWNGRLLASVGSRIRIYALGKKKLLKKCEYRNMPECVTWLRVIGDRVFAADIREGFHVLRYREKENVLHVLADDFAPFWTTCAELLDYHTVIGADKFEGMMVARVPLEARNEEKFDTSGLKLKGDMAYITGQCHKLQHLNEFHLGDMIMSMQKTTLTSGSSESIVYATINGAIGAFLPLATKDEAEFLLHLEMVMRSEHPPLCGRDHLSFRSYYSPCKQVVDGDLCEQFVLLSKEKQTAVANELDRTIPDIIRKLEDFRQRVM
eukprot:GHVP01030037.1.p1 GENE.GHVP01030037.1~~GHVP01030037.1.p1  ORF type:complete len:1239 (+),score=229.74 GHVP01030037.1:2261-5977(+)